MTCLLFSYTIRAQQPPIPPYVAYDFVARDKVLFEDNFLEDTIGDFPVKWRLANCLGKSDTTVKLRCHVEEDSLDNVLIVPTYSNIHLEQKIAGNRNLADIFSLEYDFYLGPEESNIVVKLQLAEQLTNCSSVNILVDQSGGIKYTTLFPRIKDVVARFPGFFDQYSYHHASILFIKGSISFYVDQHKMLNIPATGFAPLKFMLSIKGPAKMKNFRLATGKDYNQFSKLLTTKKIVSHDFQFYEMRSTIKSYSMAFLYQLSKLLKANPSVNIELDVHSDNSSDPNIAQRISQARADELKRQLIVTGIEMSRITAKGMGDTKPMKSNSTPEGMAMNRRVELIIK